MPDASSLVLTKVLLPSKQPNLLRRQRLVDFIHEHINRKLVLVSASAGYGKTSLVVDFAHDELSFSVCWYSVDEADRDLVSFLEYLIVSIRQHFPDFGRRTESALSTNGTGGDRVEGLLGALVNDIHDVPDYFAVAIDDYHFLDGSREVNALMGKLLRYLPENCHLIISSRTIPSLGLDRMALRQEAAILRTDDLRFTASEVQAFLKQAHNVDIPDEQAEELAHEAKGWIAAILATIPLAGQELARSVVQAKKRGSGQVYDYLASNVLEQQPVEIQRFLKDSSILREMSPALCDALLGSRGSTEMLRDIEKRNLFVSRLDGNWYRYHHLFQKFLQDKLRLEPERFRDLHRRAGKVLQEAGNYEEAIRHYVEAGAHAEAAEVIRQTGEEVHRAGRYKTLFGWIDSLSDEVIHSDPELLRFLGRAYTVQGREEQALASFEEALVRFREWGDEIGASRVLAERSTILRITGRLNEAIADCQAALSTDLGSYYPAAATTAHRNLGICYAMLGYYHRCAVELEEVLASCEQIGDSYEAARTRQDLSTAYWFIGQTARADLELDRSIAHWRRVGNFGQLASCLNNKGVRQNCRGRHKEALETLEEALTLAREAGYERVNAVILASLGDVYRSLGDLDQALELHQQALETTRQAGELSVEAYALNAIGEIHRLKGALAKAREMAYASLAASQRQHLKPDTELAQLSLGVICYEGGDVQEALEWLEKARQGLEKSHVKQGLARVHFHLAQAHFLLHHSQNVRYHLCCALDLIDELGYDHFIVADARRMRSLIQYAISRQIGEDRFARLLEKGGAPLLPRLEIRALGTPQVLVDGSPAKWRMPAAKEMFFYLLAYGDRSQEQIVDVFWPDLSPDRGRSRLKSTAHWLREALRHKGLLLFERDGAIYRLNPEMGYRYDVEEFEELLRMEPGDGESRAEALRQAIALYRGEYVEEFYSDWCSPKRRALEELYLNALTELAYLCMDGGSYDEALNLCERALQRDGYHEEVYRLMMTCYSLRCQPSKITQVYHRCVEVLDELGVSPAAETEALYQELLNSK